MRHFLLVISILSMGTMSFGKMHLIYQWKYVDLLYNSPQERQKAINSGAYNTSASYLYDVDKAPDGRIFLSLVRDIGVPASLVTVTNKQGESGGPLMRPYPDWSWYKEDCEGIRGGVYQMDIKCNHLFVVDDGRERFTQKCLPQLLIFDLSTDKLVKRVTIPLDIAHNKTSDGLLASIYVYAPDCKNVKNDAVVFMGDCEGAGIVIYNARTSMLCRIESDFMRATDESILIENLKYPMNDTIFGITLIGKYLYYAALAGNKIYKVEYSKLMECSEKDLNQANQQTQLVGALGGQTPTLTSDRCAIFFNDITKTAIMCADATKEINSKNKDVIAYDPIQLQFASGMKIRSGELFVLTDRYQIHASDAYNIDVKNISLNEINFRVFSMPIKEIEKKTKCFSSCK